MRAALERLFVFPAQNPADARILIIESPGLGGRLVALRRGILAGHARSVERAIADLTVASRIGDRGVLARCWVGAVSEGVRHWLELPAGERRPPGQVASEVAWLNLGGWGVVDSGDTR